MCSRLPLWILSQPMKIQVRPLHLVVCLFLLFSAFLISTPPAAHASATGIVISQVYGGGGNAGSTFKNDFIEIFNADGAPVDLTGWSVQYASAAGTTWQVTALSGSIAPGQYFLIQESQGAGGTTNLPTPNATGTIAMAATAGKVALVSSTTALSGSCPVGGAIVDFVGYGTGASGASCFEGTAARPLLPIPPPIFAKITAFRIQTTTVQTLLLALLIRGTRRLAPRIRAAQAPRLRLQSFRAAPHC